MKTTTLTIKRPNGNTETVDVSDKFPMGLTDGMFATIKAATADAGRGECLSYTVKDQPLTEAAMAEVETQNEFDRWLDRNDARSN